MRYQRVAICLVVLFVAAFVWLGVFPHPHSRITMNQIRAAVSMTELETAEKLYAQKNAAIGYTCDLGRLVGVRPSTKEQPEAIDRVLAAGEKAGYVFRVYNCKSDSAGKTIGFSATAVPANDKLGRYAFCADERGIVWYSSSGSIQECFEKQSPSKLAY